jgi:hypothetical protein
MKNLLLIAPLLVITVACTQESSGPAPQAQTRTTPAEPANAPIVLTATLAGTEAGDPDGSGNARVEINEATGELCYELTVQEIAPATAAHIHRGAAGESGGVVVPFDAPTQGTASGCSTSDAQVLQAIVANPSAFYVNVHNSEYPPGAVRGQLSR